MYTNKKFKFWSACYNAGIKIPEDYIKKMYLSGNSCNEIAEHFQQKYSIVTSVRNINNYIKKAGVMRNRSESKRLAIKKGRMVYDKKSDYEKKIRKNLQFKKRIEILERDNFKCSLCGNGKHNDYSVEVHHKDFNPENNSNDNLQTLCWLCHEGLHN